MRLVVQKTAAQVAVVFYGTCLKLAIDNPVKSFYYEAADAIAQSAHAAALYG